MPCTKLMIKAIYTAPQAAGAARALRARSTAQTCGQATARLILCIMQPRCSQPTKMECAGHDWQATHLCVALGRPLARSTAASTGRQSAQTAAVADLKLRSAPRIRRNMLEVPPWHLRRQPFAGRSCPIEGPWSDPSTADRGAGRVLIAAATANATWRPTGRPACAGMHPARFGDPPCIMGVSSVRRV